jgi:CRISPR-associated protein Cmr4
MGWKQYRYLLVTLDPVHIGVGGYRLGRVDMAIAREPGTNLPKIPGTSLSGAARSYAAYQCGRQRTCAGQKSCGDIEKCPICYTFGFQQGTAGNAGTVSMYDGQLLLFPVHSMVGPVWVTTQSRLAQAGFTPDGVAATGQTAQWLPIGTLGDGGPLASLRHLNLGWMMLSLANSPARVEAPERKSDLFANPLWEEIGKRSVLVDDSLFSHIVNSNLEVRTSVSIDPETGAARSGALFTYEAIPRAAILWFDIVEDCYHTQSLPANDHGWKNPANVAESGMAMIEFLGIGGMGTRGFGRAKVVASWQEQPRPQVAMRQVDRGVVAQPAGKGK